MLAALTKAAVKFTVILTDVDAASVVPIPGNATVTMTARRGDAKIDEVTCSAAALGADWNARKIVGTFSAAQTALWTPQVNCSLEIDISVPGSDPDKWLSDPFFSIVKGLK